MPPYLSHILQLLDLVCFLVLKCRYRDRILALAQYSTKHIKKEAFLLAFKKAFNKAFLADNICASFRAAGLVLLNLEVVLLKLDVVLRTPTPLALQDTL